MPNHPGDLETLQEIERTLLAALDQCRAAIRLARQEHPNRGRLVDVDDLEPGDVLVAASHLQEIASFGRVDTVTVTRVDHDPDLPDTRWILTSDGRQRLAHAGDAIRIQRVGVDVHSVLCVDDQGSVECSCGLDPDGPPRRTRKAANR